jgi:hypothetical protein
MLRIDSVPLRLPALASPGGVEENFADPKKVNRLNVVSWFLSVGFDGRDKMHFKYIH